MTEPTNRSRQDEPKLTEDRSAPASGRRPYRSPEITEYGSVAKLTQGNGGSGGDMQSQMMCL